MAELLYKVTGPAGEPINGGSGAWPLPQRGRPGRWRRIPKRARGRYQGGPLRLCYVGLHLTPEPLAWLRVDRPCTIWEAEGRGESLSDEGDAKIVFREARLLRAVAVLPASRPRGQSLEELISRYPAPPTRKPRGKAPPIAAALIFGVDRLPPSQSYCPAWPSPAAWERRLWQSVVTRSRRILGLTPAIDRLTAAGVPLGLRLAGVTPTGVA